MRNWPDKVKVAIVAEEVRHISGGWGQRECICTQDISDTSTRSSFN
jgi:hypothetical protein